MNYPVDVIEKINKELESAKISNQSGLEGRGRVCCRRAAAAALSCYLDRMNMNIPTNTLSILEISRGVAEIPLEAIPLIDHLLLRVDQEFNLPAGIDLEIDTRRLINLIDQELIH
jgi:hypothetical protein